MKETRELLMKDYNDIGEKINVAEPGGPIMEGLYKERDSIRNELIKLDSVQMDAKYKKAEIEAENKRDKIRNRITIGTFAVSTIISIWAVVKTFRFDQESTVTSTLGRSILNNILPKSRK